jgi:hypothetical protein
MDPKTQADLDNHANQLNPNNEAYHSSRGEDTPDDIVDNDTEDFHEEWIPNDAQ